MYDHVAIKEIQSLDQKSLIKKTLDPYSFFVFFKILFIYLTERETARAGTQAGGVGEGEAGFPPSREPDAGLDPRTLGS